jgi:hypothetical protein
LNGVLSYSIAQRTRERHGSSANNLLADWKIEVGAVADFATTLAPSR